MNRVDAVDTVEKARRGDRAAFEQVFEQHAGAAWRLALAVRRAPAEAADAVAEGFGTVLGPQERTSTARHSPVPLQLLAATRDAAVSRAALLTGEPGEPGDEVRAPDTHTATAADTAQHAFDQLPERWRSVLWLTEVEGLGATAAGVVLGLSPLSALQLHDRALAGLREQFTQAQVASATQADCRRTAVRLGGYVAGTLEPRDSVRVRRHLDRCAACRARLDAIDDLGPRLHRHVLPLSPMVLPLAELVWRDRSSVAHGPLGLTLPSGRPLPAWTERALAGATAAVVTVGITAAILAGGRNRTEQPERFAQSGQTVGTPDGESALGIDPPASGDGSLDESTTSGDPSTPVTRGGSPTDPTTASGDPAPVGRPRSGGEPNPATPTPTSPPTTTPGGSTPPTTNPPPPPTPSGAPPLVSVIVDEGTGVTVGECTGVEVLGIVLGCEPEGETEAPIVGGLLGL
jgi:DNA-directed RNA polymerase specialized sigma24 family protein